MSVRRKRWLNRSLQVVLAIGVVAVGAFFLTRPLPGVMWRIAYAGVVLVVLIDIALGDREGVYDRVRKWLKRLRGTG